MLLTPEIRLPPADGWAAAEVRERWKLARFPRLFAFCRESGAEADCQRRSVAVDLTVGRGSDGEWRLEGRVQTTLDAECQRCLEPLLVEVESDLSVGLTGPAGDAEMLEWPVGGMTLAEVLEDEIFLAMPRVPAHGDVSDCGELVRGLAYMDDGKAAAAQEDAAVPGPFAGLRDLLARADEQKTDD
jgi:uncharacterized protein